MMSGSLVLILVILFVIDKQTAVLAIEPVLPDICGTKWQIEYAAKHEKALKGDTTANRYVIDMPVRSGSADNLLGFISMFAWALLTDRIFIKYQSELLPMIELAYQPATFNWLARHNPIESRAQCVLPTSAGSDSPPPCDTTPMKVLNTDTQVSNPHAMKIFGFDPHFWHNDINKYPADHYQKELMLPVSARGLVYQLFNNPFHNETLKAWGLRKETIFGCIFHYLLQPRDEVCKNDVNGCAKAEAAVMKARATPNTVLISVQLRNGDSGLEFECAGKLEAEYKAKGISVQYILMNSDSHIQGHYKAKYGDRIILPSWTPQTVVDFHHAGDATNKFTKTKKVRANMDLARDVYINSLADVHVIAFSGLGSMTAALRPRDNIMIYRINTDNASEHRDCKVSQPDSLESVSTQHSGL